MSKEPLVTIGLPCYNVERYVDFAINSIFKQTYKNWELLIIDDNSTDNTFLKLRKYKDDVRVKLIKDGKNEGLPKRLNQLIELSKGKYFIRMDADDIMDINRVQVQVEYLEGNPSIDVLGTEAYVIDNNNQIQGKRKTFELKDIKSAAMHCAFIHPTVAGKLSWFKINKYNENCIRMEDYELWVRTIGNSNFFVLHVPLLYYREIGQKSLKKYLGSKLNSFKIVKDAKGLSFGFKISFLTIEYMKIFLFSILYFINQEDFLIKKRSLHLGETEKKIARERLNLVIS
ncbi:glycosyltransferase family 2 protein [Lacihabitans sp. LS3-19]|uniref:glycosyltransferase family 2 protein n=1 Tax=Lacihabitans sp. LS3-19 TaxID=2487335 RepID=UPI0020CE1CE9|nr:glycosyltransferase family 2 protein [Lacihabitans sp. LS3-19]MCP9769393.1 glycosyltransferase family 2 protein [Lacihabitans sp. LS3-19]